jgi:glycosyltransferase involved in cell wall biosynthesis
MSRLAFFYPPSSMPVPVEPNGSIWTSARGLTGSEGSCVSYAVEMAKLGHSVTLFVNTGSYGNIDGVHVCPYWEWGREYCRQGWDFLLSWMTPEPLKHATPGPLRVFNQQVSNFACCEPGWESYVDILAPLSHSHGVHMGGMTRFPRDRWFVMHNGVDLTNFSRPAAKVPGRMIWASSHDRGLHWLLEALPRVTREVPGAELHVYYNFSGLDTFCSWEDHPEDGGAGSQANELGRRSRYTREAIRRLRGKGVVVHGSASRVHMREAMAQAEILPYPLDPVQYTETFGVTVLEACASGTVPVICEADAFGELWGPASLSVPAPYELHKDAFIGAVVGALTDGPGRRALSDRAVRHAKKFSWDVLARRLDDHLHGRGVGLSPVKWGSP